MNGNCEACMACMVAEEVDKSGECGGGMVRGDERSRCQKKGRLLLS